jgi:hypothetical protein
MVLVGGAAQAATASSTQTVNVGQTQVTATAKAARLAPPAGLPSYELRSDGLLINGLMPEDGSQG